jgi:hypothetical protein
MPEPNDFKFFLNTTEVEEPTGFDSLQLTLRRSDLYSGLEFSFSDTMEFVGSGAQLLRTAFETDGFDAVVDFRLENCGETFYQGVVNFAVYTEKQSCPDDCAESIAVGIQQSGLTQRFKNRIDTPVDLSKATGIDGNTLTEIIPFDLALHSKLIVLIAKYRLNPQLSTFGLGSGDDGNWAFTPPFEQSLSDIDQTLDPFDFIEAQPFFYSGFVYPPGITERVLQVDYRLKFELKYEAFQDLGLGGTHTKFGGDIKLYYRIRKATTGEILSDILLNELVGGDFENFVPIDWSGSFSATFPADTNLYFYLDFNGDEYSLGERSYELEINFDTTGVSFLNFTENSVFPASTTNAYLVHEAFYRLSEAITGQSDCFRSDFFGGTTAAVPYPADGCGRYLALTNGLNIRKMLDKNCVLFPITTSFKDLFDAMDAIYSLGMRVEMEDGVEFIRVEPKSYFYNPDVSYVLKHVAEIERSFAVDFLYNEAEFGYQKWETEAKNGIDEFNSKRNYSLPIIQAKRKLSNICQFVTGGYALELTRRLQFATDPTKDSTYDNENFLIACINAPIKVIEFRAEGNVIVIEGHHYFPSVVVSGSTSNNGTFTTPSNTFLSGTTELYADEAIIDEVPTTAVIDQSAVRPEKDENFTGITNIISPETAYNLRLSPARMLLNWYPILAASMVKKVSPAIKFQTGTGNYQLSDTRTDACSEATGALIENQDVTAADIVERLRNPYYVPELYQFSFPISLKVFLQLKAKATMAIGFGCQNLIKGYLREATYQPGEGIAQFKVLRAFEE